MAKDKFKDYQKIDGDEHINLRLERNEHNWYDPETITEDLLEDLRVPEKEHTIEKLLEQNRTGGAEVIIERQLDTATDEFGSKHRNPEAYEGDINKIEEWRVSKNQDPIEDEDYKKPASEFPKDKRWWEVKSPDGLKIAKKNETVKQAEFGGIYDTNESLTDDDFSEFIDPDEYEMSGGEEEDEGSLLSSDVENEETVRYFDETGFRVENSTGTPEATGTITVDIEDYQPTEDSIESELRSFMSRKHPDLPFSIRMFDTSQQALDRGIFPYRIGVRPNSVASPVEDFSVIDASSDFPIVESSKKK